mmetsp:Transcript_24604/g.33745  ORF Transcript_24604/g.33745 Transcript_24604/m.33745 type:complete len:243 (-) Transcript_24604:854-1582(-)
MLLPPLTPPSCSALITCSSLPFFPSTSTYSKSKESSFVAADEEVGAFSSGSDDCAAAALAASTVRMAQLLGLFALCGILTGEALLLVLVSTRTASDRGLLSATGLSAEGGDSCRILMTISPSTEAFSDSSDESLTACCGRFSCCCGLPRRSEWLCAARVAMEAFATPNSASYVSFIFRYRISQAASSSLKRRLSLEAAASAALWSSSWPLTSSKLDFSWAFSTLSCPFALLAFLRASCARFL